MSLPFSVSSARQREVKLFFSIREQIFLANMRMREFTVKFSFNISGVCFLGQESRNLLLLCIQEGRTLYSFSLQAATFTVFPYVIGVLVFVR